MSTMHHFDTEHARRYGLPEAVLIGNLYFWVQHNYANGTHDHDGRTWTYNSIPAFELIFPYFTYRQVRHALDSLVNQAVIIRGNYNARPADRTSWFAFTDEFLSENPLPKKADGTARKGTATARKGTSLDRTDVNTVLNTDGESLAALGIHQHLLDDYLEVRKAKKAGALTPTAVQGLQSGAKKAGISLKDAITACCELGWQGFNAGWYAERTAGKAVTHGSTFAPVNKQEALEARNREVARKWAAGEQA
jgi:hypothetical protein